jgi:hypothetical protein
MQTVIKTSRRLDSFLHEAAQNFELLPNIQDKKLKIKNLQRLMSFSRPVRWYHSHADPICPEGTFSSSILFGKSWRELFKKRAGKCHLAAADSAQLVAAAMGVPPSALHASLA